MKKYFLSLILSILAINVMAFDYIPKNTDVNPFGNNTKNMVNKPNQNINSKNEVREIKNLTEYFKYLPHEVNRNWIPYRAESDYEVTVKFKVHNDGSISNVEITDTTNTKANYSVLNAVKNGAPYQPLPKSYPADSVTAQVILEYHK